MSGRALTEADVRRIVREELAAAATRGRTVQLREAQAIAAATARLEQTSSRRSAARHG